MEQQEKELVTPFDMLTSSKSLRMMKLMLPYTKPQMQRFFAVYIRFMELQETMRFYRNIAGSINAQENDGASDIAEILAELAPYLPSEVADAMEQFEMVMTMMEGMNDLNTTQEGVDTE